ncbi:MAG: hypothetical protein OXN97_04265 [Bryobacterales bacterium]|nr:hypothetical protein [Bryobacterales bacterium]MDE0629092.1 hypothetical protein [Bryobacterales bacterium]
MLRRSFTAVLEKGSTFDGDFATEPYEAGWALEARWFVNVLRADDGLELSFVPQVSPDGSRWCDSGEEAMRLCGAGLASLPMRNFGSWLRLDARMVGTPGSATLIIYLALKG